MAAAAGLLLAASAGSASAATNTRSSSAHGDATCWGGSVAAGTYSNLNIAGSCTVDAGSVSVTGNLTVLQDGSLIASYGGSNLTIGGNAEVRKNGVLVLGCEPLNYICTNDPDQKVGSYYTRDWVEGNLTANNALTVLVHLAIVVRDVSLTGGGGGVSCGSSVPGVNSPPYGDLEDDAIGGNLTITGWQSCWLGVFRTTVLRNVVFNNNVTADPDGNELGTNSIIGNLSCSANSPNPQLGDSGGSLTNVYGHAYGQCANPKLVR